MSTPDTAGLEAAADVARHLQMDPVTDVERYESEDAATGIELVPGLIYQFAQTDISLDPPISTTLTVYLGVGDLGQALWEHEARALTRIGRLGHVSLPTFLDSGVIPDAVGELGAAYVRTRAYYPYANAARLPAEEFRGNPAGALLALWNLADALSTMHGIRLAHRALWTGALAGESGVTPTIRITRFEMSGMLANLLRSERGTAMGVRRVRDFYMRSIDARSRVFAPPERLDLMFGTSDAGLGDLPGDVYGLGMIAAEWLFGPELLDGPTETREDVEAIRERVRKVLSTDPTLPPMLTGTILEMISTQATGRISASTAAARFGVAHEKVLASMRSDVDELDTRPYLIGFIPGPDAMDATIKKWGLIEHPSSSPAGRREAIDFVEGDMRGASVVRLSRGAIGFVSGADDELKRAAIAIVGTEVVWFCGEGFITNPFQRKVPKPAMMTILRVRRTSADLVSRLLDGAMSRKLHSVSVASLSDPYESLEAATGPDWGELVPETSHGSQFDAAAQIRLEALRWYLDYQRAALAGREYAYELEGSGGGTLIRLRWDRKRDIDVRGLAQHGLARVVVRNRHRPTLIDFVGSSEDDGESLEVELFRRDDRGGGRGERVAYFPVNGTSGSEVLELRNPQGLRIDQTGWLRLKSDSGSDQQLTRQTEATEELANNIELLTQLVDPTGARMSSARWAGAGVELFGTGSRRVVDVLEHEPMFALQGPPGTGKTEVTSQAVAAYLRDDPGARVLVSAQSHDALDNLAARILKKLGMDDRSIGTSQYLALRVIGRFRARVSGSMNDWLEDEVVSTMTAGLRSSGQQWLKNSTDEQAGLVAAMERWLAKIDDIDLDLRARVRRGANLVFATTGTSTRENLVDRGSTEPFDWVIVEEAGRAWPTELALPLVRGQRWTLIGDHAQIGPFGFSEVQRFLEELALDEDEDIAAAGKNAQAYADAFNTFGTLMTIKGADRPRAVLQEQYRMREGIAAPVSRAFYGGLLKTPLPDQDHGFREPAWAAGKSLVWIDTEDAKAARGFWDNEFEAEIIADIVRSFEPGLGPNPSLAILTPYRKQVATIAGKLSEHGPRIRTIDSFQGLEADVVIASLVRDRDVDEDRPDYSHIGHLADPGRSNVLLSRARRLLILVGRFETFDRHGGDHWRNVTRVLHQHPQARILRITNWSRN